MTSFVLGIHIMASFLLILIVLLQSSKGGGLGGAFGGVTEATFGAIEADPKYYIVSSEVV